VTKKSKRYKPFHIDKRAAAIVDADTGDDDDMLSLQECADFCGESLAWIRKRRILRDGPEFEELSPRVIRCRRGTLKKWLKKRSRMWLAECERRYRDKRLRVEEARA
jgi:hypothetical protein